MEDYKKPQALDDEKLDQVAGGYNPADYVWVCEHCNKVWTDNQIGRPVDGSCFCPRCGGLLAHIG